MKHILSAKQFSRNDLEYLISEAQKMDQIVQKWGSRVYDEKIMATLFYEPSTRTRLSFESAMLRLGGKVISETDIHFSSQSKWEILEDTIRIISGYADLIVIRSKTQWDALRASLVSSVPVINAWDGAWEHPSQSLLDLYTISKNFSDLMKDEKLNITFVGDLRYGRTVHSLSILLRNFPNISITFIAPESLNLPEEYRKDGDIFTEKLDQSILEKTDVLYMTRVQKERFPTIESYEAVAKAFILEKEQVLRMKKEAIIMHPLPRIYEIPLEIDTLPQAHYFEQAKNGLPMRMALVKYCLEN